MPKAIEVLFLDDDHQRHREFDRWVMKDPTRAFWSVAHVYTADEAIHAVERQVYDGVFLDHDLCTQDVMIKVGEKGKEPTGMDVVDRIVGLPKEKHPLGVVVHSLNGPAADEMLKRLLDVGVRASRVPFTFLIRM